MLVVGDVTGRGAQAAALTGLMRHTLRTAATLTGSVAGALEKLNRDLCSRSSLSLCTAVCVLIREDGGERARVELTCAGHPLPLLVRGGQAEPVGRFGPLLGAHDDARWASQTVVVDPGDVLVLYSDGVLDTVGAEDRFGVERLRAALTGAAGAADAVRRIEAALAGFQVGRQADDTAVLAVERLPVAAARRGDAAGERAA
jgi:serine phosphatase RsbU (regulator of sigma subunit)